MDLNHSFGADSSTGHKLSPQSTLGAGDVGKLARRGLKLVVQGMNYVSGSYVQGSLSSGNI